MRWPLALTLLLAAPALAADAIDFGRDVRPIFQQHCHSCHGPEKQKSGYRLDVRTVALEGGEIGPAILPGRSAESPLVQYVTGAHADLRMPPKGEPLTPGQIATLKRWIDDGAPWPDVLAGDAPKQHWAFEPLARPEPPLATKNPVDAFIRAELAGRGLSPSARADRRTLIRRVTFDLTGLPPAPDRVGRFIHDPDPDAYDKLVDELLASPRYGERWARHWLDAVHYGDTHGFDKDKPRPNAWPYRDYVIRSLNGDKPYARFVEEQLAADHFHQDLTALGFLAAGPWDLVGHTELRENTLDKSITRNLDRDDYVATTFNTFLSLTAQCARCHNHKFDPITQEDYHALQSIFAAIDRADRPYDPDPATARERMALAAQLRQLDEAKAKLDQVIAAAAGPALAALDARIADAQERTVRRPEYGYHSAIEPKQDAVKWVQVDLGESKRLATVTLHPAHDDFNDIGPGFGFPVRFKVGLSDDPTFATATLIADHTDADVGNPGVAPQSFPANRAARYIRLTATELAPRQNDYVLALAEVSAFDAAGHDLAAGAFVTSLDSIEAPPRWRKKNLTDGRYPSDSRELESLRAERLELLRRSTPEPLALELSRAELQRHRLMTALKRLPDTRLVYAAATHFSPIGAFKPTNGQPRPVHLLHRGNEKSPRHEVHPRALSCIPTLPAGLPLAPGHPESARRAALARWITDPRNVLTWRSIVNRVWHHHFGRGLVDSPNDFGRMGSTPTHPELLDFLAVRFRDDGQSLKQLHRLILTSDTYKQSSLNTQDSVLRTDADNRYLWRMNRTRLDAESVRDAVLSVSGKLDATMFGPPYRAFRFKDDHSPTYAYADHDPDDPASRRRSIYRLIVRSAPDPFFESLDCADPSQLTPKRNETLTPLQALTLLNNPFMLRMSQHLSVRVSTLSPDPAVQVILAHHLTLARPPTPAELHLLLTLRSKHGLPTVCRTLINTNEFLFID